jgi:hypothetical protein
LEIGERDADPDPERNCQEGNKRGDVVDCVETLAEGNNAFANDGTDSTGESVGDPAEQRCYEIGLPPDGKHSDADDGDQGQESNAALLYLRKGAITIGENSEIQSKQNCDARHVKDAFHGPDRELRREREVQLASDDVRAHEFAGASEEGESGEAEELRNDQARDSGVATWFEKDLPTNRTKYIYEVSKSDGAEEMNETDSASLNEQRVPIEALPCTELNIDEHSKDDDDDRGGEMFFHSMGERKPDCRVQGKGGICNW